MVGEQVCMGVCACVNVFVLMYEFIYVCTCVKYALSSRQYHRYLILISISNPNLYLLPSTLT